MTKIALVCSSIMDGQNVTPYQRSVNLADNYELYIIAMTPMIADDVRKRAQQVAVFPFKMPNVIGRYVFSIWAAWRLLRLRRQVALSVVYTTFQHGPILAGMTARRLGFSWIADIWDDPNLSLETMDRSKRRLKFAAIQFLNGISDALIKRGLKKADLVICALMPIALSRYKIEPQKMLAITNGVVPEIFDTGLLSKAHHRIRFIYVGFVREIRGVGVMLESFARMMKNAGPAELILIGPMLPEDQQWLRDVINRLGVQESVVVMGKLEHQEVLNWLRDSDICLFPFPRKRELEYIYPIKVLEYMAMGKAIIASGLAGTKELVEHEVSALLYEPDNVDDFTRSMERLYFDVALRSRIGENARERCLRYSWSSINARINERLAEII